MSGEAAKKIGILLVNLGTPDAPRAAEVGEYLREFLMDEEVIDIPKPLRWFLVHRLIVPKRAPASAEAYAKIWSDRGSPLKFHSEDLARKVGEKLGPGYDVRLAMRYRGPSIRSVLEAWQAAGLSEIRVLPLYPQYARASNLSTEKAVAATLRELGYSPRVRTLPAFYRDPGFIRNFAARVRGVTESGKYDHVLFSFHGLPERQVRRAAPECGCLRGADECAPIGQAGSEYCYRAHCYETARAIAQELGLRDGEWSVSFQSRLGRTKWIEPYTDVVLPELVRKGVWRVAVACPAFVADCLETLEEIGIRAAEQFRIDGGDTLTLVPSLNSDPDWVETVARLAKDGSFR